MISGAAKIRRICNGDGHWSLQSVIVARSGFHSMRSPEGPARIQEEAQLLVRSCSRAAFLDSMPGAPGGKVLNAAAFRFRQLQDREPKGETISQVWVHAG